MINIKQTESELAYTFSNTSSGTKICLVKIGRAVVNNSSKWSKQIQFLPQPTPEPVVFSLAFDTYNNYDKIQTFTFQTTFLVKGLPQKQIFSPKNDNDFVMSTTLSLTVLYVKR